MEDADLRMASVKIIEAAKRLGIRQTRASISSRDWEYWAYRVMSANEIEADINRIGEPRRIREPERLQKLQHDLDTEIRIANACAI